MYQLVAAQQASAAKLPAFFQKFQTEERVLNVNKSKITCENTFNEDHVPNEVNYDSNNDKKYFGYFTRFVVRGLTLRLRKTFTYGFQTLFGFGRFCTTSCQF